MKLQIIFATGLEVCYNIEAYMVFYILGCYQASTACRGDKTYEFWKIWN